MTSPDTDKPGDSAAFKLHPASSGSGDAADHTKLTYRVNDRQQFGGSPQSGLERLRVRAARAMARFFGRITGPDDSDLPVRIGSRKR